MGDDATGRLRMVQAARSRVTSAFTVQHMASRIAEAATRALRPSDGVQAT
jgi:hypothetical protein